MTHARRWSGDTCDHTHHDVPDWPPSSLEQRTEEPKAKEQQGRYHGDGIRHGLPDGDRRAATDEGLCEGRGRTPSYPRLISTQQPSVRCPFVCPVHSTLAQPGCWVVGANLKPVGHRDVHSIS